MMLGSTLLQLSCLVFCGPLDGTSATEPLLVKDCLVTVKDETQIPARQSGVVTDLLVREGSSVTKGEVLARLDRMRAQRRLLVALREEQAARKAAEDDVDIRYAKAVSRVAIAEHAAALAVNNRVANTVPQSEVRRLQLEKVRADLQIEQSHHEKEIESYSLRLKEAEVRLAEVELLQCDILSPQDGMVVQVFPNAGEWVNPGDPICTVMRVDQLMVEGFIDVDTLQRRQILSVAVRVRSKTSEQPLHGIKGNVQFVSPEVDAAGGCRFWAQVNNVKRNGEWVLRPGVSVDLLIDSHDGAN